MKIKQPIASVKWNEVFRRKEFDEEGLMKIDEQESDEIVSDLDTLEDIVSETKEELFELQERIDKLESIFPDFLGRITSASSTLVNAEKIEELLNQLN